MTLYLLKYRWITDRQMSEIPEDIQYNILNLQKITDIVLE